MRWFAVVVVALVTVCSLSARAQAVQDGYYTEPFLTIDPGSHSAAIRRMDVDRAGRLIVTGSEDKTVRLWSADDGKLLRTFAVPAGPGDVGKIYAVALSPDGKRIAAGGYTGRGGGDIRVYLIDPTSGQITGVIHGLPNVVTHLAFSPDGSFVALGLWGSNGIRVYAVDRLDQPLFTDSAYGGDAYGLAFAADAKQLLLASTSEDGQIRLYRAEGDRFRRIGDPQPAPGGKRPYGIDLKLEDLKPEAGTKWWKLAIGYEDSTRVDGVRFRLTPQGGVTWERWATWPGSGVANGNLSKVAWLPDGRLAAGGRWQQAGKFSVRLWQRQDDPAPVDWPVSDSTIMALRPVGKTDLLVAAADPSLGRWRAGRAIWQVLPGKADLRDQRDVFAASSDGRAVRFGFAPWGREPVSFDLAQRRFQPPAATPAWQIGRTSGGPEIGKGTTNPMLKGKPLTLNSNETSRSLAVTAKGDGFILGADGSLRRFDADGRQAWQKPVPGVVWGVTLAAQDQLVVAAYDDGTIRWHRFDDGTELLALFAHRDGRRWVAWMPQGYYVASPDGEDLIRWQVNRGPDQLADRFPASRFRDQFYRPDIIDRILIDRDPAKAVANANLATNRQPTPPAFKVADYRPPQVAILSPSDGSTVAGTTQVTFKVQDQPGRTVRRVWLMLDGMVIQDETGLTMPASGQLDRSWNVTLSGEGSILSLLAESDQGASELASIRLNRAAPMVQKKTLWVMAVGIDQFQQASKLDFAPKDAEKFADVMRAQKGGLYGDVKIRPLIGPEATRRNIAEGFQWLDRNVGRDDVAVLFLSTHGQTDARDNLYLIAADTDSRDEISMRYSAIPNTDVTQLAKNLAERGKVLVFLDACHAGNVIPGAKSAPTSLDRAAAELASAETGAVVFTSSTGRQFSYELKDKGHGAFTYALLEAFRPASGAARSQPFLDVADLEVWLARRVRELTNGSQTPRQVLPTGRPINHRFFTLVPQ